MVTAILRPNGTVANAWTVTNAATAHEALDDPVEQPTAGSEADGYLSSSANNATCDLEVSTPSDVDVATDLTVWMEAALIAGNQNVLIAVEVRDSAGTVLATQNSALLTAGYAWTSVTMTGQTWNQATINGLRIAVTSVKSGGGAQGTIGVRAAYGDLTYTASAPPPADAPALSLTSKTDTSATINVGAVTGADGYRRATGDPVYTPAVTKFAFEASTESWAVLDSLPSALSHETVSPITGAGSLRVDVPSAGNSFVAEAFRSTPQDWSVDGDTVAVNVHLLSGSASARIDIYNGSVWQEGVSEPLTVGQTVQVTRQDSALLSAVQRFAVVVTYDGAGAHLIDDVTVGSQTPSYVAAQVGDNTITDLQPNTAYTFEFWAYNSGGDGPSSTINVTTDASGAAHTRAPADSVGITDGWEASHFVPGDPIGITDAVTPTHTVGGTGQTRTPADPVGISDAVTATHSVGAVAHERTVDDSVGLSDVRNVTAAGTREVSASDSVAVTDSWEASHFVPGDPVGITDEVTVTLSSGQNHQRAVADSIGIDDTPTEEVVETEQVVPDSIGITDTVSVAHTAAGTHERTVADAIGITDTVDVTHVAAHQRAIADGVAIGDSPNVTHTVAAIAHQRSITDSIGATDTASPNTVTPDSASISDGVGISDAVSVAKVIRVTIVDEVGISDDAERTAIAKRAVADAIGIVDSARRVQDVAAPFYLYTSTARPPRWDDSAARPKPYHESSRPLRHTDSSPRPGRHRSTARPGLWHDTTRPAHHWTAAARPRRFWSTTFVRLEEAADMPIEIIGTADGAPSYHLGENPEPWLIRWFETLRDNTEQALALFGATEAWAATVHITPDGGATVSRAAEIIDPSTLQTDDPDNFPTADDTVGWIRFPWHRGDLDAAGDYLIQVMLEETSVAKPVAERLILLSQTKWQPTVVSGPASAAAQALPAA